MKYFLSVGSIISFRDAHMLIGNLLLAVLAIAFLLTIIDRVRKVYVHRNSPRPADESYGGVTTIVARTDVFLLITIMLTFLYFKSPVEFALRWYVDQ